jgi:hypothetical protein
MFKCNSIGNVFVTQLSQTKYAHSTKGSRVRIGVVSDLNTNVITFLQMWGLATLIYLLSWMALIQ